MINKILLFFSLLCSTVFLFAQEYDTTKYNMTFISEEFDMWGGTTYKLPAINKRFGFGWDEEETLGGIESVLGMDFGVEFYAKTFGDIGFGFYMSDIGTGWIDSVTYPINVQFIVPKAEFISPGQTIKISSIVTVDENEGPAVETTFPLEGKAGVTLTLNLETDLHLKACAFDQCLTLDPKALDPTQCLADSVMDFTFDRSVLELSTLNSNPRATIPALTTIPCLPSLDFYLPCVGNRSLYSLFGFDQALEKWPSTETLDFFPIEFGVARTVTSTHPMSAFMRCRKDTTMSYAACEALRQSKIRTTSTLDNFLEGSFSIPFVSEFTPTIQGNILNSRGYDEILDMKFSPLNLTPVSKFLDGELRLPIPCTGGDIFASYMLFRPSVTLDVLAHQDFKLDAKVMVTLELPAPLNYRVEKQDGTLVTSGLDSIIHYRIGNDLYIDFPCNYEFMDFKPTFTVDNQFTNRTYTSLAFDGIVEALEFGIGMDDVTIIPEIELCIWIPFHGTECATIPAVTFEFELSVGPLITASLTDFMPNSDDLTLEIDIFKKTWEIDNFPTIETGSFRVAPSRFLAFVEPDTIMCNGQTAGELYAEINAGTPPFSYEWSNNTNSPIASNLPAGDYYVKVTDKNGCSAFNGATVFEFPELFIDVLDTIHPECFGDETGSIRVQGIGGNPPFTYAWSNGATSSSIGNLPAGEYSVTVSDANDCSVSQNFIIHEPTELISYINNTTNLLCNGVNTGSIMLNVSGGVPGYDFHWSNGAISQNIDSLLAGTYSVTVIDRHNCQTVSSADITEPELLVTTIEMPQPISCYRGDNGSLFANTTGGVEPYSFVWYSPQYTINNTTATLTNLKEGLYQMELTDANGCYRRDSFYLNAPQVKFESVLTETHLSCKESNDGAFELAVSGGTPPYSYVWSDGATEKNREGMEAGQYKVTITDAMGCFTYNNMVLLEPFEINGAFTMKKVSCDGELDGTLEFIPNGGTPPFTFHWDYGQSVSLAANLPQGMHTVLVTDANDCSKEFEYELLVDGSDCFDVPNAFSPNGDNYNDTWVIKNLTAMYPNHTVKIFTQQGYVLYNSNGSAYEPWNGKNKGIDVPSGTYYYVIDLGDGSEELKGTLTIVR